VPDAYAELLAKSRIEEGGIGCQINHRTFGGKVWMASVTLDLQLPFRLQNDLYCVKWGVKLYSLTHLSSSGAGTNLKVGGAPVRRESGGGAPVRRRE